MGNIGSNEKTAYTSIGDVVTIAEELEGMTKQYQAPILLSGAVVERLPDRGDCEQLDEVEIEGKTIPIYTIRTGRVL